MEEGARERDGESHAKASLYRENITVLVNKNIYILFNSIRRFNPFKFIEFS